MIPKIIKRFNESRESLAIRFRGSLPSEYREIVRAVIEAVADNDDDECALDPKRIHEINDGDYGGIMLYLIPENKYHPYNYWYVRVAYGTCGQCDTLEAIRERSSSDAELAVRDCMTLALHIAQSIKKLGGNIV